MDQKLLDVKDIQEKYHRFGIWDYVIFVVMLVVSASIGVYFAFKKTGTGDGATEYLMGGRKMSLFPISMSLIAGWVASIMILGACTEMYFYGTKYIFVSLALLPAAVASAYVFLPVFYEMELSSTYEYLERRFDKKVRLFSSAAFILLWIGWLPIEIYALSLAINQVTGISLHMIPLCLCTLCTFYTTMGGLKAVIWADVFQTFIMAGSLSFVIVKGAIEIGGFDVVWQRNQNYQRIEIPSFQLDFTDRHTIWSIFIGKGVYLIQAAFIDQGSVQRYMALPTLKKVKSAICFYTLGTIFFSLLSSLSGLVVYATYYDCDPLTTELVKEKDQLLPLFVQQILGDYSGMPGLFIAGLFCATLSSLSTGLEAMSVVVVEDFIKASFPNRRLSNRTRNIVMKGVVIFFGVLCLGLVFVVENLGTVAQLAVSLVSVPSGPSFGVFCGGMLLPWMNAKGAFYGALIGLGATGIVVIGAEKARAAGQTFLQTKPSSVDGCEYYYNATTIAFTNITSIKSNVFPLFKMSYLWFGLFGTIITLISGMIISFFTGFNDPSNLNPSWFSPLIRKYLPKRRVMENEGLLLRPLKKNEETNEK